jgi:hypothetical protein
MERLIGSDVLGHLQLAAPFRLGDEMHDDALTVLRILILNRPQLLLPRPVNWC